MVVLFHLNAATHAYAFTRNAWVAVDFFFVLSGFVLMAGFGGRVNNRAAFRRFAVRRLARLYPLHLAALVVLVALVGLEAWRRGEPLFARAHGLAALLQCLALVQGFTTDALSWNFPSWSISLELWASLLFGLTLWLARTNACVIFGLATVVLGVINLALGEPSGPAATPAGALLKAAHYLLAFVVGAVLFNVFGWVARRGWEPPSWGDWPGLALVAALFLFADRLDAPTTIAAFALVIFVFAFEAGPVSRALRGAPFQAIGRWSYSIYLVHPLWTIATLHLVAAAGRGLHRTAIADGARLILGGPLVMDAAAAACLSAVIATAALTFRLIEQPGARLAKPAP